MQSQHNPQQVQQNQQYMVNRPMSATTPNIKMEMDNGMGVSTPQTIPPPASSGPSPGLANGPHSTPSTPLVPSLMTPSQMNTSNQTPPHPGTTPSPAGLGKGMTSQERAALNAPRSSSMSSQMAAISAAAVDQDNSPSPMNKGKLDTIKDEPNVKMEIEDENGDGHRRSDMGGGSSDKNVNNDTKIEIKQEPSDSGENASESIKVLLKEYFILINVINITLVCNLKNFCIILRKISKVM